MKIETIHPKTGSEAESEIMSKKRKLEPDLEDPSCSFKVPKLSNSSQGSCTDNHNDVPASESKEKSKKEKQLETSLKFRYGNFYRYYGHRLKGVEKDPRLEIFNKDWFRMKNVLDIGCNAGYLTLSIAKEFEPAWILGIDIDPHLIGVSRKNIKHYVDGDQELVGDFPKSLVKTEEEGGPKVRKFPQNIWFRTQNYVPEFEEQIEQTQEEYDVIMALSVTKWIHLNWGDEGMKKFFRRVFHHMKPGGRFILETQIFESYYKRAKTLPQLKENYKKIQFKPDQFKDYLLNEVGFETCEDLGVPKANSKGFERPLQVFKKKFCIKRPKDSE